MNPPTFSQQRLEHRHSIDLLVHEYNVRTSANSYQVEETLKRAIQFHKEHFKEDYYLPREETPAVLLHLVALDLVGSEWDGAVD